MIPLYAGFDRREEVGFHTFTSSVIAHSSYPVAITPLNLPTFKWWYPVSQRDGSNHFIYTRFLIPFLQGFKGWAIFADGADMVVKADLSELWALRDPDMAVQVVQHDYQTRHPRKYLGTSMETANEDYPRKNWSSLMLINAGHAGWRSMTPERVSQMSGRELHTFSFLPQDRIGALPAEWNWLADEYGENPQAKLLHYTAGIPAWKAYEHTPHADDWRAAHERVNHATP